MALVATHQPVMLEEALDLLRVRPGGVYVDCTVGLGGHAEAILERLGGKGLLVGLDRDGQALNLARERLAGFTNCRLHHENYKNLPLLLEREPLALDGCLLDLGISSLQLDEPERGFSFRADGPLDMRMDRSVGLTAAQVVNQASTEDLVRILREYGEDPRALKIARAIVQRRQREPFRRTLDLAEVVAAVARAPRGAKIHPATRVFQALRIEVNQELAGLAEFLEFVIGRLVEGGRLVAIAFQSLEDRVVKRVFRRAAGKCVCFRPADLCTCPRRERVALLTKRPLRPGPAEVRDNPRARSARLRAVERLSTAD
ncbi:MAG: 16S rRNA (cytosine(1402)-N(4))-methyltransferase RsmH [Acidobacteriota bacterium]